MGDVTPIRPELLGVLRPDVLPHVEQVRAVPISEPYAKVLENLGLRLGGIGAHATADVCLAIAAAWKVAPAA